MSIEIPSTKSHKTLRYVSLVGTGYRLHTWDTGRSDSRGASYVGYAFYPPKSRKPLFAGTDFSPGMFTSIDSNEALRGLLGFLTLRPGDTDEEYFEKYTPEQLEWAIRNGEMMSEWGSDDPEAKKYCKFRNL